MNYSESPVVFDCEGDRLIGVIATPDGRSLETGVLIVVGGPQYRAGSHRQFTLLARDLAKAGICSLRVDYRGMGDSEGASRTFDEIDTDIAAAIDAFLSHEVTLRSVVIWGICDAASAALMYGHRDSRVAGLILLNPWVHTEASAAQVRLKQYYLQRLLESSFWMKLVSGEFRVRASARDLIDSVRALMRRSRLIERLQSRKSSVEPLMLNPTDQTYHFASSDNFITRMVHGLSNFEGGVLILLSGNDLTASEFALFTETHPGWRAACRSKCITSRTIPDANHTFSGREWRDLVSAITIDRLTNKGAR